MKKLIALLLFAGCAQAQIQPVFSPTTPIVWNGAPFIQQGAQVANPSMFIGTGAGAASTMSTSIFNVGVGWQAFNALTSGAEDTAVGVVAMPLLTTGNFNTALGEHAGGYITTESADTFLGNDSCRNCVGGGNNTAIGKQSLAAGGQTTSIGIGFAALIGNATSITIGGSATNGDVITLTVTANNFSTQTVNYTVTGGQTTAQIATGVAAAIQANTTIINPSQGLAQIGGSPNNQSTIQVYLSGTCTAPGYGFDTCFAASVSGAATETVTITGGDVGNNNIAIGNYAMAGYQMTTSNASIAIGQFSLANLTTGAPNIGIGGANALVNLTTGSDNISIGYQSSLAMTSGTQNVAVGDNALSGETTASGSTAVGYNAAKVTTNASVVAIGASALIADTTTGQGQNTCVGTLCGQLVTSAGGITGVGYNVLPADVTGSRNTAMGWQAGLAATGNDVTAFGYLACDHVTAGSNNTCLGSSVGSTTILTGTGNILIGTSNAVDTVAAGTSNEINIGGLLFYNTVSLVAPVVSACGTTPSIDTHANNRSGTVTVGTVSAASCTVTFAGGGYTTWNHCRVTSQTTEAAFAYSYTKTVLTVTGTSLVGDLFDYDCDGV